MVEESVVAMVAAMDEGLVAVTVAVFSLAVVASERWEGMEPFSETPSHRTSSCQTVLVVGRN